MTHRTYRIAGTSVDVFDSTVAGELFAKRNSDEGMFTVLVRGKHLIMRRGDVTMTVNLRREPTEASSPPVVAAHQIADEVERFIEQEKVVA